VNQYKHYVILETGVLGGAQWYKGLIISAKQSKKTGFLQVRNKWRSTIPESAVRPLTLADAQADAAWIGAREIADRMMELGFPLGLDDEGVLFKAIMEALGGIAINEIIEASLRETDEKEGGTRWK
jgi:hypothetical protein